MWSSPYELWQVPPLLTVPITFVALMIALAPFLKGKVGQYEVPVIKRPFEKPLMVIGPAIFLLMVLGFFPILTPPKVDLDEYADQWVYGDPLKYLIEISADDHAKLQRQFGDSTWDGGKYWGTVVFDTTGRAANYDYYTRYPSGKILIQGWFYLNKPPFLMGEYLEPDKARFLKLEVTPSAEKLDQITVRWSSDQAVWKRQ